MVDNEDGNAGELLAVCDKCRAEFAVVENLTTRPLPDYGEITQVVIACPECGDETLGHYDTPRLREERARLRKLRSSIRTRTDGPQAWRRAHKKYARLFDQEQKRVKRLLA